MHWYDIDGNEISIQRAEELLADIDARRIAYDEGDFGAVSTVHLVLDHGFFRHGPPLIFESMHFTPEGVPDECVRTPNKVAALAAHDQLLCAARETTKARHSQE